MGQKLNVRWVMDGFMFSMSDIGVELEQATYSFTTAYNPKDGVLYLVIDTSEGAHDEDEKRLHVAPILCYNNRVGVFPTLKSNGHI